MELNKLLVTTLGVGLVGLIYWFFLGKKEEVVRASSEINIIVDGGYKPAAIRLKKGIKTTLKITRKDPNTCLEEIILPEFKIKKYLPLNEQVDIEITPQKVGEVGFHCGMNMYHGKIIVE